MIDEEKRVMEYINYFFGFCKIEIKDKIIYFNGKWMIINGVNWYEWYLKKGCVIIIEDMEKDLVIIKKVKINGVWIFYYFN